MAALNHGELSNKENKTMARKKKRTYGTGGARPRHGGVTLRWREKVIQPDGAVKIVHRSQAAGKISQREATDQLRTFMATIKTPTVAPMLFEDFVASWKALVLPKYPKHSTRKGHEDIVDNKLVPFFRGKALLEITGEHIQQFITAMENKRYSAHSIHHYHSVLSTMLTTAVNWKRIADNPAFKVKLPKLKAKREQWVLTTDQANSLLLRLSLRAQVAIHLAFLLRRGEVFAARWKHFDAENATLRIVEAVYDGVVDTPKTENSARVVPLPQSTVQLILQWKAKSKRTKDDDFILAGRKGTSGGQARMLKDHIKPACAALGLKPATWLTFRRSWNTWADGKGVSPKMRGEIVGNSAEVNSRVYTKTIADSLRNAVELVGETLCANCAPQSEMVN
jgi:integrase